MRVQTCNSGYGPCRVLIASSSPFYCTRVPARSYVRSAVHHDAIHSTVEALTAVRSIPVHEVEKRASVSKRTQTTWLGSLVLGTDRGRSLAVLPLLELERDDSAALCLESLLLLERLARCASCDLDVLVEAVGPAREMKAGGKL